MKNVRFWLFLGLLLPCSVSGATDNGFKSAAQLLAAARRGDTRTIQHLINNGADINYIDSTGLSVVCTAVKNNDKRAIQVLQMYGADASECDKQIKNYDQKNKVAASGKEYGFFSGLSSSHIIALSAVGVGAVIAGVALLTDVFDSKNNNGTSSSGGSHSGDGDNSSDDSSTALASFTIPYGPEYLNKSGVLDKNFDIKTNLVSWDLTNLGSAPTLKQRDFMYLIKTKPDNYLADGLNPTMENYLLAMGGYYLFASGYMGQSIFRDDANVPLKTASYEGRPVRVALISGNGINPAGSADSANGIFYAMGTTAGAVQPHVDKYLNNKDEQIGTTNEYALTEKDGYDFSNSGSAFNPFANVNDSALAKIIAGWEAGDTRSAAVGDLYGFVPNGQLAVYRTGNGKIWKDLETPENVGSFEDKNLEGQDGFGKISSGDEITIDGNTYTVKDALSLTTTTNPTVTVDNTEYKLASASKMFVGECSDPSSGCTNITMYIGTDGMLYVNSQGGNNIDSVYSINDTTVNKIRELDTSNSGYANFSAMWKAATTKYKIKNDSNETTVDVIANTAVIPASRTNSYTTTDNFVKALGSSNLRDKYISFINNLYGTVNGNAQGAMAHTLFNSYSSDSPMIVMPAGDYLWRDKTTGVFDSRTYEATFENYAPMLTSYYGNNLRHNFMTIVGVAHKNGTSAATTITGYGDGTSSSYGKLNLATWYDNFTDFNNSNAYASRMCGITGIGDASNGVDPWCFAASGPTAEMATASAAGAVASIKAAFSYMTNDQVFTLLALTADGPYLKTAYIDNKLTNFTTDSLVTYLKNMYDIPADLTPLGIDSLSASEYLNLFKRVYGYGLINLRRAITPGNSVYYYNGKETIVATDGAINQFWGKLSARASSVLSLANRAAITTSFYDKLESLDGSISLPRVWKSTLSLSSVDNKHGLYMGDVLGDFHVDSTNKQSNQIGNFRVDMAMSQRAYNDNLNGLDDMRIAWTSDTFDLGAEYQHYLTDGESRFDGRANGVLGLISNTMSANTTYKNGRFGFGGRAFVGTITDENLLDKDPTVSSQFEPGRLGLANGGSLDTTYMTDKFALNVSVGAMRENNTVLGMLSKGILGMNNADTKYIDTLATYKPFDNVKLSLRGTFATTHANKQSEFISDLSDIKSNAFAFGTDIGGFSFTFALPLAVTRGYIGYGDADFEVVENNGKYEIAVNNPHMEYIDLSAQKRELRFSTSYKHALGEFTDAGVGLIYRVNPNNTDAFGNESILMFKLHHRLGI